MSLILRFVLSLLPVFAFLVALIVMDSYKLVRLRSVLVAISVGCVAALICMFINKSLLGWTQVELKYYSRYIAPLIEEIFKAAWVLFLIRTGRVGFMVDAAIFGFAVGSGFAFIENSYYLNSLNDPNLLLWTVRGFGTAVMHGGTAAIFGIISKHLSERYSRNLLAFVPGLILAIGLHSGFNHFLLPPLLTTLLLLVALPTLIFIVFERSEAATRDWLGIGFDTDINLLEMLTTGNISQTRVGQYLNSLKEHFPGEIVADMLCLLRLHLELAIRAKGVLLLRETGFNPQVDPEIRAKFKEIQYLEKNIGKTGKLAILPFLHQSTRDLWQLYFLK